MSPVALTRSSASPASGAQPRVTSGRTNADAPQAPRSSGKRKPPYPNDLTAVQASHTPTGPIGLCCAVGGCAGSNAASATRPNPATASRSEEHTSELQSQSNLVCRLLLEKKKYQVSSHSRDTNWSTKPRVVFAASLSGQRWCPNYWCRIGKWIPSTLFSMTCSQLARCSIC